MDVLKIAANNRLEFYLQVQAFTKLLTITNILIFLGKLGMVFIDLWFKLYMVSLNSNRFIICILSKYMYIGLNLNIRLKDAL